MLVITINLKLNCLATLSTKAILLQALHNGLPLRLGAYCHTPFIRGSDGVGV